MNINSSHAKLVLLWPAWRKFGTANTVKSDTAILHSWGDEVIPFADSEELIKKSWLPTSALSGGVVHEPLDHDGERLQGDRRVHDRVGSDLEDRKPCCEVGHLLHAAGTPEPGPLRADQPSVAEWSESARQLLLPLISGNLSECKGTGNRNRLSTERRRVQWLNSAAICPRT